MEILEALKKMDPLDNDQWTADGTPRIDFVKSLVGDEKIKVDRQSIIDAAPEFSQENSKLESAPDVPEEEDLGSKEDESNIEFLKEYIEAGILDLEEFKSMLKACPNGTLSDLDKLVYEQGKEAINARKTAEELERILGIQRQFVLYHMKARTPDMSNQEAIQHFLKSQNAVRSEKASRAKEILKGIDISSLDPRSTIDRAMARKTKRGGTRPIRSLR